MAITLANRTFYSSRHIFRSSAQFFGGFLQQLEVMPSYARGAPAANKFHAPILAHLAAVAHQDNPDLRRALHVRAPARLQVRAFNLNRAQDSLALHFFAHAALAKLLRGSIARGNRAILTNNFICYAYGALQD